jgi:hypothetical protein
VTPELAVAILTIVVSIEKESELSAENVIDYTSKSICDVGKAKCR